MNLTPQQQRVVEAEVGNLLVSAAAGSGKTSVMTERITSRILEGKLDLRRVLVMTFTNAAAANMRDKIEKKLTEALAAEKDIGKRRRISEQISFLPLAHISTIHSFCLDVIGNFGYDARTKEGDIIIEPGFITLDPTRVTLMFQEAMEEVLTSLYEQAHGVLSGESADAEEPVSVIRKQDGREASPFTLLQESVTRGQWFRDFERMTASLGSARNDENVKETIRSFHSYLRSMPGYESWIREKLSEMRDAAADFEKTAGAQTLMSDFRTALALARPALEELKSLLPEVIFIKTAAKNHAYRDFYGEQFRVISEIMKADESGTLTWNMCVRFAGELPEGKGASSRGGDDTKADFLRLYSPVKEVLYYLTGICTPKDDAKSFRTPARRLFAREKEELEEELSFMIPVAARLFEVLLMVDDRYSQKKRAENGIDFSDYEHLALLLLSRPEAKKYYTDTFSEIYIDEYQDNSRIQDAIVSCFSSDNCFAVGDVKQSIYRFRHAKPQLFLDRMQMYRDPLINGTLLELNSNFRSVPGVLALVNDLFSQILSAPAGEIDYDDSQKLFPERPADPQKAGIPTTELLLVDLTPAVPESNGVDAAEGGSEAKQTLTDFPTEEPDLGADAYAGDAAPVEIDAEDAEELARTEKSVYAIIVKIRKIRVEEGAEWRDIAVLTRKNDDVAYICDMLNRHGIPAQGGGESEFLSNRELLLMENFMRLLDNFRQDIPLAAVMRAPFPKAGFTPEEMLEIALSAKEAGICARYYHEKVIFYREYGTGANLVRKVGDFCDWIDSLRSRSMYLRVSELIEKIYAETGYLEKVSGLADGGPRVQALETFREWANSYEGGRNSGLYRFVTYIEDIWSRQATPEEFDIGAAEGDAVRCMSIHKSKGLEFKYVFLAGLDSSILPRGNGSRLLLSEKLGIGIDYIRPDGGYCYPTHYKLAMETEEMRAALAEHMRVLYVAMTRAEERLYLVGCVKRKKDGSIAGKSDLIRYARQETQEILPAWLVLKAKSYLDWCLMGLARNPAVPTEKLLAEGEAYDLPVPAGISQNRTGDVSLSILPFEEIRREALASLPGEAAEPELAEALPCADISPEEESLFRLQFEGRYPFEELTGIPAKMSVSEIKRRVSDYSREPEEDEACIPALQYAESPIADNLRGEKREPAHTAESAARPVNLVVQPIDSRTEPRKAALSAAEKGTLLHSVFQYLDFASFSAAPDEEEVSRAVRDLEEYHMIRADHIPQIRPYFPSIAAFAASALCSRMNAAEAGTGNGPFREIPFSITVPVGTSSDVSLVQGMIDCWFIEGDGAVLLDYKSDVINGTRGEKAAVLQTRYGLQLDYYAKAIEAASGIPVRERIIWLIPDGISFSVEAPEKRT